jgi:membrane glycosyltransferase
VFQTTDSIGGRRFGLAALVTLTISALIALMVMTLLRGGYDWLDFGLTVCFLVTLPWTVIGFWNAVIGLCIMRLSRQPARVVCPFDAGSDEAAEITARTAVLICIRNEDVRTVRRNLDVMFEELVQAGVADRFHAYILSDSSWSDVIGTETRVFGRLEQRWRGALRVTYRHRQDRAGFKAGNIRDFCDRWGERHDYALVLDADSLMSTERILGLVRTMQGSSKLGILQSLIVGMPTVSTFARIFQFGMRLGMRSYTLGSAWWQADCGPYWGHNALIRLKPFMDHCRLPELPGRPPLGGSILSHDQVEAALMRRAGYEVRVLPSEGGSWEENPPTLLEFIRRDLRWCHGNMQYWRLICMPGLKPISRVQLFLAILMFLTSPAWIAFMTLGMLRVGLADDPGQAFDPQTGLILFGAIMTMVFAPKLATVLDLLATSSARWDFGGATALVTGTLSEVLFFTLLAPVMALAHTRFLAGLPFGHAAVWPAQRRVSHRVRPSQAFEHLWLQSLFGAAGVGFLMFHAPAALMGFLPFLLGPLLAIPIAILTSGEGLGARCARSGLWRIPDETQPAPALQRLHLPALSASHRALATSEPASDSASGD